MREYVLRLYRNFAAHRTVFLMAAGYFLLVVLLTVTAIVLVATTSRSTGQLNQVVYTSIDKTQLLFKLQADAHALQTTSMRIIFNTETEDVELEKFRLDSIKFMSDRHWDDAGRLPDARDRELFSRLRSACHSHAYLRGIVLQSSVTGARDNEQAIGLYYTLLLPSFERYIKQLEAAEHALEHRIAADLRNTNNDVRQASSIVHILIAGNFLIIVAGGILLYRHLRKSIALREKLAALRVERQREISRMTIDIQEKQRVEIGRELHDNVNQLLTAARLQLSLARDSSTPHEHIERSMKTINSAIREIRVLSKSLVSPLQDTLSFRESLFSLVETFQSILPNCVVHLHSPDDLPLQPTDSMSLVIYRILQEQFTNIAKHANPTLVVVKLTVAEGLLVMSIRDNGRGFDTTIKTGGIGLQNIINRAEAFDGQVEIVSCPGSGCTVKACFPMTEVRA